MLEVERWRLSHYFDNHGCCVLRSHREEGIEYRRSRRLFIKKTKISLDCRHRAQLCRACQRAEQDCTKGAVLLPEAHYKLRPIRWQNRNPSRSNSSSWEWAQTKWFKLSDDLNWFTVELGVVIGKSGRDIPAAQADSHIAGYGNSSDQVYKQNILILSL